MTQLKFFILFTQPKFLILYQKRQPRESFFFSQKNQLNKNFLYFPKKRQPPKSVWKNRQLDSPNFLHFLQKTDILNFILDIYNKFSFFFAFYNIFFYTQLAFIFYLLRDSYIVHDHILAFFLKKILISFRRLFFNLFFVF